MFLTGRDIVLVGIVRHASPESVQPAGVDLTLAEVELLEGPGLLGKESRVLPKARSFECGDGLCTLAPGVYRIRFGEAVSIPQGHVGLCFPRSSLLRMGVYLGCAVWDPGYTGRGQALLAVLNPHGFQVEIGARIAQLVVARVEGPWTDVYRGVYIGEGLKST